MRTISKIPPLLLLASALSLSSCVNEVKNPVKVQDSVSQLTISYTTPDPSNILRIALHASLTPPIQKNYRLDWDFGDTTGIISWFDTNNLVHVFKNFGPHLVTLTVIDSQTKVVLRKTSMTIDIEDIAVDTNYIHGFGHMRLYFQAKCICAAEQDSIVTINFDQPIYWQDKSFRLGNVYTNSGMGGEISYNGDSILSAWYELGGYSYQAVGYHGFDVTIFIKYIDFHSLKKSASIGADSLIFLSMQNDVTSKITTLLDTVYHVYTTFIDSKYLSPGRPGQSKEIIFSDRYPPPILKVTFYK